MKAVFDDDGVDPEAQAGALLDPEEKDSVLTLQPLRQPTHREISWSLRQLL